MSESVDQPSAVTADHVMVSPEVRLYYEIRSSPSATSGESLKMIMIMGAFATMRHYEEQAQFLVEHFTRLHLPIEVLTYDHRGIGKSTTTVSIRQTSRMLANDALALLDHVWGSHASVHIYGASLGGMVAQELALLLLASNRLRSLYLAVTSRGSYLRPMAFGPSVWRKLMPLLIKQDREHMVRHVLLPATFSPAALQSIGEVYASRWIEEYDQWWAFGNEEACACQCSAAGSHYLTDEGVRLLRSANIPITVQIASQDKLMPPKKQRQLATLLNAQTVVFDHGHMGDDHVKQEIYRSVVDHLKSTIDSMR